MELWSHRKPRLAQRTCLGGNGGLIHFQDIHYVMSNKTERLLMNMKKPMFVRPSSTRETFNGNSDLSRPSVTRSCFNFRLGLQNQKAQSGRQKYNGKDDRDTCQAWNYNETRIKLRSMQGHLLASFSTRGLNHFLPIGRGNFSQVQNYVLQKCQQGLQPTIMFWFLTGENDFLQVSLFSTKFKVGETHQGGFLVEFSVLLLQQLDLLLKDLDADVAELQRRGLLGHIVRVDLGSIQSFITFTAVSKYSRHRSLHWNSITGEEPSYSEVFLRRFDDCLNLN